MADGRHRRLTPQAGRRTVGRVGYIRLVFGVLGRQPDQDPGEHALLAPAVVEDLVWAVILRRVALPQPIAIEENNPA